jgi:hypothetical protein
MKKNRASLASVFTITLACIILTSCGGQTLSGFNDVVAKGQLPLEFGGMKKSVSPTQTAYELSFKNNTGDTIISFDYTMVKIDGGVFSGVEEESFGGNYIVEPGEEFSILCRVETDAEEFKFLLKSVSWKDLKSGALFRWDNKEYDQQLRKLKLTGNR